MIKLGHHTIKSNVLLAPMAGISDLPFRTLCQKFGAGLTTAEMVSCQPELWHSKKSSQRLMGLEQSKKLPRDHEPLSVQIVGNDPKALANTASRCERMGADIVDINLGCPAKKVCNRAAGSALLKDEKLVMQILTAVAQKVTIPVTVKIRTGWCQNTKNGLIIAKIAEESGLAAITVHGRTRMDRFQGEAEYDTIASIKDAVTIPVFANGDIDSPKKAKFVIDYTRADGVVIGRASQGRPWLFREINHFLATNQKLAKPSVGFIGRVILDHIHRIHQFYGESTGVRIARKHIDWYFRANSLGSNFKIVFNKLDNCQAQSYAVSAQFKYLINRKGVHIT